MRFLLGSRGLIRSGRSDESGFTVAELVVVMIILGLLAVVAPLELKPTNNRTTLRSAVTQVGRALKEAYSIAQQEKLPVTVSFFARDDSTVERRNTYEVLRGVGNEPVPPPIGVSHTAVSVGGVVHYYCKLGEGGRQPTFPSAATVYFRPMGASTMCVSLGGTPTSQTITISHSGLADRTVTVNEEGEVYP